MGGGNFFNCGFAEIKFSDGSHLLDSFDGPVINFIVDPPASHHPYLRPQLNNCYLICLDHNHVAYAKKYYPHFRDVIFGFIPGPEKELFKAYETRSIDVLFTGTYDNPDQYILELEKEEDWIRSIIKYIIYHFWDNSEYTTEELLLQFLKEKDFSLEAEGFSILMARICWGVERYMRAYYRDLVIGTLVNNGIKVHVYGNGWEDFPCSGNENIIRCGAVPYEETIELTGNAKISLNIMPWFKAGLHDRILTSMFCKTVCLTDSSTYIDEHFNDRENIIRYSLKELERLPTIVNELLANPEWASKIAAAGYEKVRREYTWKDMARRIADQIIEKGKK